MIGLNPDRRVKSPMLYRRATGSAPCRSCQSLLLVAVVRVCSPRSCQSLLTVAVVRVCSLSQLSESAHCRSCQSLLTVAVVRVCSLSQLSESAHCRSCQRLTCKLCVRKGLSTVTLNILCLILTNQNAKK